MPDIRTKHNGHNNGKNVISQGKHWNAHRLCYIWRTKEDINLREKTTPESKSSPNTSNKNGDVVQNSIIARKRDNIFHHSDFLIIDNVLSSVHLPKINVCGVSAYVLSIVHHITWT